MNYIRKSNKVPNKSDNHDMKPKQIQFTITEDDINSFFDKISDISNPDESSKKYTYYSDNGNLVDLKTYMFRCLSMTQHFKSFNVKNPPDFIKRNCQLMVTDYTPVSVAKMIHQKKAGYICIMNFASPKFPGGGFISGKNSQETNNCCQTMLLESLMSNSNSNFYENMGIFKMNLQMRQHRNSSSFGNPIHALMSNFQPTPQSKQISNQNKSQSNSHNQSHNNQSQTSHSPQINQISTKSSAHQRSLSVQKGSCKIQSSQSNSFISKAQNPLSLHGFLSMRNRSPSPVSDKKERNTKLVDKFSYKNGFIYSPNVPVIAEITDDKSVTRNASYGSRLRMFDMSEVFLVDFISITPVDKTQINESLKEERRENDDSDDEDDIKDLNKKINEVMKEKIRSVIALAAGKEDFLILGGFGCGFFGHNAKDVVKLFIKVLFKENYARYFEGIYFAMGEENSAYRVFQDEFKKLKNEFKHKRKNDSDDDD